MGGKRKKGVKEARRRKGSGRRVRRRNETGKVMEVGRRERKGSGVENKNGRRGEDVEEKWK